MIWLELSMSIKGGTREQREKLADTLARQAKWLAKDRGLEVQVSTNEEEGK